MAKYMVTIPPPSAKRMAANVRLIVKLNQGWEGRGPDQIYHLLQGTKAFEFEVSDEYEWMRSSSIIDGCDFLVYCEYTNSTGSRKETRELVPEKIS